MLEEIVAERAKAVFISDLHLSPHEPLIDERFKAFVEWAATHTESVYILGDFFHVWAGDDEINPWSEAIAEQLNWLSQQGVSLYFMHGNRDFLLGSAFAKKAGFLLLQEPTVIRLGDFDILLVHGDRYCTQDKAHQYFRRITRTSWFPKLFLRLPYVLRIKIVMKLRQHSQQNKKKELDKMNITVSTMLNHMKEKKVKTIIHGHIHKPGLTMVQDKGTIFNQYVLSDWEDNPSVLCYYKTYGLKYILNVFQNKDKEVTYG